MFLNIIPEAARAIRRLTPGAGGRYNPGHAEEMTGMADWVRNPFGNPGTTEQGFLEILQNYCFLPARSRE